MDDKTKKRISKRLSYVLRHNPSSIGVSLLSGGWIDVDDLLIALKKSGRDIERDDLAFVVENNDKQRFEWDREKDLIRARQGHSVEIDLEYEPVQPPDVLYQGTATRFLDSIFEEGLIKGNRHHVHLSVKKETLLQVGARHGKPAVLAIDAKSMFEQGYNFYVTGNDVWLTEHVPPEFLREVDLGQLDKEFRSTN